MLSPAVFFHCRLKSALARRTGRSEEELCFEERRRSARVAEEENLSLEENGLFMERGNRRARKEEPKLSDVCILGGVFFSITDHFDPHQLYIFIFSNRVRVLLMLAFQSLKGR